ncbi:MAG: hypothetical protein ACHQ53_01655 [Polyangiales bacterium]
MTPTTELEPIAALLVARHGELGRVTAGHLRAWLSGSVPMAHSEWIARQLSPQHLDLLLDAFWQVLPFGTGGRRGRVGYGPNRINPATIAMTVQGHCDYLRAAFGARAELQVVVANDVRTFLDLGGAYRFLGDDHPLLRLSSRGLAKLACEVYAGNGITALISDPTSDRAVLATPELSFVIAELNAAGGVNLSASHNPPDDNGIKLYDHFGSQPVPPADQQLLDGMSSIAQIRRLPFDEALAKGLVREIPRALHGRYLAGYVALYAKDGFQKPRPEPKIVFTPLCGCGLDTVGALLRELGFPVLVPPDEGADGSFAVIPFRAPNPEIPQSTGPARRFAEEHGSSIVLSSDPDADRVGLEVRLPDGGWEHLDGNQIAAILAYALMLDPQGPRRAGLVIETLVTTKLLGGIARLRGSSDVIDDLLVGFKYVADVLKELQASGRYAHVARRPDELVLAAEESHGVILLPGIRDKDAAGACMILAALHQRLAAQDENLLDYYAEIIERVGAYDNVNRSIMMAGAEGVRRKDLIMAALREGRMTKLADQPIRKIADYWDESAFGPFKSETDRSARNIVQIFTDSFIVTVRPSGTEPKLKFYVELLPSAEPLRARGRALLTELRERSNAVARSVYNALLAPLSCSLGDEALFLPDVIDLDRKLAFDREVVPELERRLTASAFGTLDEALGWLRERTSAIVPGADPLPALKAPLGHLCRRIAVAGHAGVTSALLRWSTENA